LEEPDEEEKDFAFEAKEPPVRLLASVRFP
jgi:hypothetical protein